MIVIGGATATGKSALAMEVAKKLDGEIIGADSAQIYVGMDIGTSKPTTEDRHTIRHHMIDIELPSEPYSVAAYQTEAQQVIQDIKDRGKVPVVVGGTGLYINALLFDYNPSATDSSLRLELQNEYEKKGAKYMHDKLAIVDEKAAKTIHPNNVKRVIRALEVKMLTGTSIADKNDKESSVPCLTYIADFPREVVYRRINERTDQMIRDGLEEEVRELLDREDVDFSSQSMQAIGYKEFQPYFKGEIMKDRLVENIKQHTRNYAKRQVTWFKRIEDAIWINNEDVHKNAERIVADYYKYFCKLK